MKLKLVSVLAGIVAFSLVAAPLVAQGCQGSKTQNSPGQEPVQQSRSDIR